MLARSLVASAISLAVLQSAAHAQSYQLTTRLDNFCSADLPSYDFKCGIPDPGPLGARADNNGNGILDVYEPGRYIEMTLTGPSIPDGYQLVPTGDANLRIDAFGDLDSDPLPPEDPNQISTSDYFDHEWIEIDMDGFDLGRTFDGDMQNDLFDIGAAQGWWGPGHDRGGLWDQGNSPDNIYGNATIPSDELANMLQDGEILFTLGLATSHNDLTESRYFSNKEEYIQFTLSFEAELVPLDTGPVLTADISVDRESGFAPLTVNFDGSNSIAPSEGITAFNWDFGDEVAEGAIVSHTFETPGTYDIELTVTGADASESKQTYSIEVFDPANNQDPTAIIALPDTSPEAGEDSLFSGENSSDPEGDTLTYVWKVDDIEAGQESTLSYNFNNEGEHTVSLTVTDSLGAEHTSTEQITVLPPNADPVAMFTATPSVVAAQELVQFDAGLSHDADNELTLFAWDFGDGNYGQGATAEHSYDSAGEYEVLLTVSSDDGKSASLPQTIIVTEAVLGAGGTFDIPASVDIGVSNNPGNNPIQFSKWDHAFFKFPLDSVTGVVTSATLKLHSRSTGSITTTLWPAATDDWDENTGRPDAIGLEWLNSTPITATTHTGPGDVEFDVTDFIAQQVAGDQIASFEVSSDSGGWLKFDSSEGEIFPVLSIVTGNGETPVTDPAEGSHKIVAIGDGITQGSTGLDSYRYPLWKKLIDEGIDVDFIGSETSNAGGNPDWTSYQDKYFDADNEGHWGWRADQIADNLPTWLAGYNADIALVHLGTNDILQGQSNESTLADIENVVAALRLDNPNIKVLLAQLIPMDDRHSLVGEESQSQLVALNTAISDLVSTLSTAQSPVILVDQFDGFDAVTQTADGIHPNDSGEEHMANVWLAGIQTALTPPDTGSVPVAVINASVTEGAPSLIVDFDASASSDEDGDIISYAWNFGGLGNSNDITTSFTFATEGQHEVTLLVTDSKGNEHQSSATINVQEPSSNLAPTAVIDAPSGQIETGAIVTFDGNSSSDPEGLALTYTWSINSAVQASTDASLDHTFATAGSYRIELTVTDTESAQDTTYVDVEVIEANTAPAASFLAQPSTVEENETVQFDATGSSDDDAINSYIWDFGDNTTTNGALAQHSYSAAGAYTVTLTVTDDEGLSDSTTQQVIVTPIAPPPVEQTLTLNPGIDIGATGAANNSPLRISKWDHGFFRFELDEANGPIESAIFRLYVESNADMETTVWPAGSDNWNESTGRPAAVGHEWLGTQALGTVSHGSQGYIEFDVTDFIQGELDNDKVATFEVSTNKGGWSSYGSMESNNPPQLIIETQGSAANGSAPVASISASIEQGDIPLQVDFNGSSSTDVDNDIIAYQWDFAGLGESSEEVTSFTFDNAGTYEVELSVFDALGNSHSDLITITALDPSNNAAPVAVANASKLLVAPGESINFDSNGSLDPENGPLTFEWNFGDQNTAMGDTAIHSYTQPGSYEVSLAVTDNADQTTTSAPVAIEVATAPTVLFLTAPSSVTTGETVQFDAQASIDDGSIVSYAWDFGDGDIGTGVLVAHSYDTAGAFTVTLTLTDDQGASASETTTVTVAPAAPGDTTETVITASDDIGATGIVESNPMRISHWDHGFLRFDLGNVIGAVSSAILRLNYQDTALPLETTIWAAGSDDWNEQSGKPQAVGHGWLGGTPLGTVIYDAQGYLEIDLTDFIKDQVAGDGIASLEISTDKGSWLDFGSSEGANPPQLVIQSTGG